MKEKKNKYGQIKRDFAKSNKSFQNLCSKDDAESMFWYEYFLEYRCRGIRVDLEQAFQLYNIKNRMNQAIFMAMHHIDQLDLKKKKVGLHEYDKIN